MLAFNHSEETLAKFKARILTLEQRVRQLEGLKVVHSDPGFQARRLGFIMDYNKSNEKQEDIKRFSHPVKVLDTLTKIEEVYDSMAKAAKPLKVVWL